MFCCYVRKCKVRPLGILEDDDTDLFLQLFSSVGQADAAVDLEVYAYIWRIYGQFTKKRRQGTLQQADAHIR